MDWIHDYQLFLFDFDGLLADTDKLQFLAYKRTCANYGLILDWDERQYAQLATFCTDGLKQELTNRYPLLHKKWDEFYREKKNTYIKILHEQGTDLMPGVADLLQALADADIPRCVVTHSPKNHMDVICKQHSVLETIPNWITREDYLKPKPDPECYQLAISRFAKPEDKVVGFEDSPRGLKALTGTSAKAFLVTTLLEKPDLEKFSAQMKFEYIPTFLQLCSK